MAFVIVRMQEKHIFILVLALDNSASRFFNLKINEQKQMKFQIANNGIECCGYCIMG